MPELKVVEVTGMDVFKIRLIAEKQQWKDGDASKMVTKFGIQTYNLYRYKGQAFQDASKEFIEAQASKNLYSVTLERTENPDNDDKPFISIQDFVTRDEHEAYASTQWKSELRNVDNFKANPDLLTKVSDMEAIINN